MSIILSATLKSREAWSDIISSLEIKNFPMKLLYLEKKSLKVSEELRTFKGKPRLMKFKPSPPKIVKENYMWKKTPSFTSFIRTHSMRGTDEKPGQSQSCPTLKTRNP